MSTLKQRIARRVQHAELARKDAANRCGLCKIALPPVVFVIAEDIQPWKHHALYCSAACRDQVRERGGSMTRDPMSRRAVRLPQARRSKYGAVKTTVDAIIFDSKREAVRYGELKLLQKAGEIRCLELQPEFSLNAWHGDHSQSPLVGVYRADFRYDEIGRVLTDAPGSQYQQSWQTIWRTVVEDVKGFDTPLSKWKRKHVAAQYGITVRLT